MNSASIKPSLSVVVPVFNVGHYLPDCLDSLLANSYKDLEIIAIDDFSRDDSWKILKLYKKLDNRIRVYRNVKHYGKALTLNRLLRKAKGDFVSIMDAKDMVYKHKFEKQVAFLHKNPKAVAVGTQCTFINRDGKREEKSTFPTTTQAIYQRPLHAVTVDFETIVINRLLLPKDALYFQPTSTLLYSDMLMKLLQFGDIVNLPQFLQYRRAENPQRQTNFQKIPSIIKLWIQSIDAYDYHPSLRSIFSPLRQPELIS